MAYIYYIYYNPPFCRSIGNALYGLRSITSDTDGVKELCAALSSKIDQVICIDHWHGIDGWMDGWY